MAAAFIVEPEKGLFRAVAVHLEDDGGQQAIEFRMDEPEARKLRSLLGNYNIFDVILLDDDVDITPIEEWTELN